MSKFETEKKLEDMINNMGFNEMRGAVWMACKAHRYLQEKFFQIALYFIAIKAKHYEQNFYDGRNEWSCKISKAIMDNLIEKELYVPMESYFKEKIEEVYND